MHGKKELFLENSNGLDNKKEEEANLFSMHELIPKKEFTEYIVAGDISKNSIMNFAKEVGTTPGIVVGQLQHKGLVKMFALNNLKQKFEWVKK